MLQLSDLLLQTGGLLLVVIQLLLEITLPGLDQSQSLFQLEVDVFLVSIIQWTDLNGQLSDKTPQVTSQFYSECHLSREMLGSEPDTGITPLQTDS